MFFTMRNNLANCATIKTFAVYSLPIQNCNQHGNRHTSSRLPIDESWPILLTVLEKPFTLIKQ